MTLRVSGLKSGSGVAPAGTALGKFNVREFGAKGDSVTVDGPGILRAFAAAAAVSGTVLFPDGIYPTQAPLLIPSNISIEMSSNATIRAANVIAGPMLYTNPAQQVARKRYEGGIIDCAENADVGLSVGYMGRLTMRSMTVLSAKQAGMVLGELTAPKAGFEAVMQDIYVSRSTTSTLAAGSIGIHMKNTTDSAVLGFTVVGYETGLKTDSANGSYAMGHCWSDPAVNGWMKTCVDDTAFGNSYVQVTADTPGASAADLLGGTIPYGFRIRGTNATLEGCRVINNAFYGIDSKVVGIQFDNANPFSQVTDTYFYAAAGAHAIDKDIVFTGGDPNVTTTVWGSRWAGTVNTTTHARGHTIDVQRSSVGGGARLLRRNYNSAGWAGNAAFAANAIANVNVGMTLAAVGDQIAVGFNPALPAGVLGFGQVDAAGNVKVTIINLSGAVQNIPATSVRAVMFGHT